MSIEKRIQKLCEKIVPFRDRNCLIKTLEDRAAQAREYKKIWNEIKNWRFEAQQDHVYELEDKYQNQANENPAQSI
jgi:hypothetical protein